MQFTEEFINFLNDNPLYNAIGIRVEKAVDGKAWARLDPSPSLCWPFPGQPHGGILFTLMDIAMATAVFSSLEGGQNCATIQADIQYTLPAKGDSFLCMAETMWRSGRMTFVRAEIQDVENRVVALGQATFRVIHAEGMESS